MIGLTGAHGTGKTTLATAFVMEQDIPLVATQSGAVMLSIGMDPKADYDFDQRMFAQESILRVAVGQYAAAGRVFIADRTPLDMAAYALADVNRQGLSETQGRRLLNYIDECYVALNRYFSVLVALQPGIPHSEERDGKAPINAAYAEHINILILGLIADSRNRASRHFIPRQVLDMKKRLFAVMHAVDSVRTRYAQEMSTVSRH